MAKVPKIFKKFGTKLGLTKEIKLCEFERAKLMHEFNIFYDKNKDGSVAWNDFEVAREHICKLSGWQPESEKYTRTQELFIDMWRDLQEAADLDSDNKVTAEEWVQMWEKCKKKNKDLKPPAQNGPEEVKPLQKFPLWLDSYIEYKFRLYDRAGDGMLDSEEFEYTLSLFDVPPKDCRMAFNMMSKNDSIKIDFHYFKELCHQFFESDDPSALGNFINGRLSYE